MKSLYTDRDALFASLSIVKTDDVPHLKRLFDSHHLVRVGDICGGYGRLRLHFSDPALEWTVFDRSSSMIALGRRLMRKHRIPRTQFLKHNLGRDLFRADTGCFDVLLLAFNSINELSNLQILFRQARGVTRPGSLFFIKSIFLPPDFPIENRTRFECFLSLKGDLWSAEYVSRRLGKNPERQTVDIEFKRFGDSRIKHYKLKRTLWTFVEMDSAAEPEGFHLHSRLVSDGITIYRRSDTSSVGCSS